MDVCDMQSCHTLCTSIGLHLSCCFVLLVSLVTPLVDTALGWHGQVWCTTTQLECLLPMICMDISTLNLVPRRLLVTTDSVGDGRALVVLACIQLRHGIRSDRIQNVPVCLIGQMAAGL